MRINISGDGAFLYSTALNAMFTELYNYAPNNYRNLVDGGDFQTNPWQRGTSITGVTSTLTYGPDRWFAVGSAGSSISMVKTANTSIAGFSQALAFGRASANTDVNPLYLGQAFESLDSIRLQGLQFTFSFWAAAGANYSGGAVSVTVATGTVLDQSAATLKAGSWTGYATPVSASFTPSTVWQRFQFTGTMAAAALQLGVLLSYTPSGSAGAADNILFHGFQLEWGAYASNYEFKDVAVELEIAQRYYVQFQETATSVMAIGMVTVSGNNVFFMALPVTMRKAPTVTVASGTLTTGILATTPAVSGFAGGTTHTTNTISVITTNAATAGQAVMLIGGAGATGAVKVTADY